MSNIKFRAFCRYRKEMISWERIQSTVYANRGEGFWNDKALIVMQYTGIRDKNGVEIYEGDLIRKMLGKHYWIYLIEATGGQFGGNLWAQPVEHNVSIDEETDRYTYESVQPDKKSWNHIPSSSEVIGNIHQNPESRE